MSELIKREDAVKATWHEPSYTDAYNVLTEVRDRIEALPTVDAVPVVHGHWEIVPNDKSTDGYYKMRCSVCGEILWSIQSEELYCCKCGAKMDECADGERRTDGNTAENE